MDDQEIRLIFGARDVSLGKRIQTGSGEQNVSSVMNTGGSCSGYRAVLT